MPPTPRTDRRANFSRMFRNFVRRAGRDTREKMNPGARDLSVVKVSARYDPWQLKKRWKTETKKIKKLRTLNGRLPPEDGSDWPETWSKRVSDDSQHFIFWSWKQKIGENFWSKLLCFSMLVRFSRIYVDLDVKFEFSMQNDPWVAEFQLSMTLGGGVKSQKTILMSTYGEKWLTVKAANYELCNKTISL